MLNSIAEQLNGLRTDEPARSHEAFDLDG